MTTALAAASIFKSPDFAPTLEIECPACFGLGHWQESGDVFAEPELAVVTVTCSQCAGAGTERMTWAEYCQRWQDAYDAVVKAAAWLGSRCETEADLDEVLYRYGHMASGKCLQTLTLSEIVSLRSWLHCECKDQMRAEAE